MASLLLFVEEEDAFWLMCTVVEDLVPTSYYSSTLIGVQVGITFSYMTCVINNYSCPLLVFSLTYMLEFYSLMIGDLLRTNPWWGWGVLLRSFDGGSVQLCSPNFDPRPKCVIF